MWGLLHGLSLDLFLAFSFLRPRGEYVHMILGPVEGKSPSRHPFLPDGTVHGTTSA